MSELKTVQVFSLKTARDFAGLTQDEVCEKINISRSTLSNYEQGKSYPTVDTLKALSELYGVPYDRIIFLSK